MKKNTLLIVLLGLLVSFIMTSCYVHRPYRSERDEYRYRRDRHHHDYDNRYGHY